MAAVRVKDARVPAQKPYFGEKIEDAKNQIRAYLEGLAEKGKIRGRDVSPICGALFYFGREWEKHIAGSGERHARGEITSDRFWDDVQLRNLHGSLARPARGMKEAMLGACGGSISESQNEAICKKWAQLLERTLVPEKKTLKAVIMRAVEREYPAVRRVQGIKYW